jgi:hypothetical protein
MTVTITLPDELAAWLQRRAAAQNRPAEDLALDLLRVALIGDAPALTLDEVVARIRTAAPNPAGWRTVSGSLTDVLAEKDHDDLDIAVWQSAWSAVEAEMDAIERANDRAET